MIEEIDKKCFYVAAEIQPGMYVLLACCILLNVACQFVIRASSAAMEDREQRIKSDQEHHKKNKYRSYFFRELITGPLSWCCGLEISRVALQDEEESGLSVEQRLDWEVYVTPRDSRLGQKSYFNRRTGILTNALPSALPSP